MSTDTNKTKLTPKDFASDQEIRWCPGCGDYSILKQVQKVLPELGVSKENFVFISGIGCSSRFPYYMATYGIHGIHGRAPTLASGLKVSRPELSVWVLTGDGDGMSIGGNHFIHTLRRNIDMNILLFNNRIYGLTKGQYSPTSEQGKVTKSSPFGVVDHPVYPITLALGAEGTFVARSIDVEAKHLQEMIRRAYHHKGTAFIEILQNCSIYNNKAFESLTSKDVKADNQIILEHKQPLIFGKNRDKGIRMKGNRLEVVPLGNGITEDDLVVHDETNEALSFLLSMMQPPDFPTPIGVFRAIQRSTYEDTADELTRRAQKDGPGTLDELFSQGNTWEVGASS